MFFGSDSFDKESRGRLCVKVLAREEVDVTRGRLPERVDGAVGFREEIDDGYPEGVELVIDHADDVHLEGFHDPVRDGTQDVQCFECIQVLTGFESEEEMYHDGMRILCRELNCLRHFFMEMVFVGYAPIYT